MPTSSLVLNFFKDLENPALYERVDGVPLFGPHVKLKKAPDGTWHKVAVDHARLEKIANQCAQMEREGQLPVISPGHRKMDGKIDEQDQPPIWGYARWLKPGEFATPSGEKVKTLLGTIYLSRKEKDKAGRPVNEAARTYPHRSVDVYPSSNQITGIALLRRDPELDNLGLVSYARPVYQYATENVMPPTDPPDARTEEDDLDTPAEGDLGEQLEPEHADMAMKYARHMERHHPAFKYMCDRYASEQGGVDGAAGNPTVPSGTNGGPPPKKKPAPKPDEDEETMKQMQRAGVPDQYARQLTAMQKELSEVKQELGETRREKRLLQYRKDLDERYATGQISDVDAEIEFTQEMTPKQFDAYLKRLDANVPAAPVGRRAPLAYVRNGYEGTNGGQLPANGRLSEAQQETVMQYMREHPDVNDWDEAVKRAIKTN